MNVTYTDEHREAARHALDMRERLGVPQDDELYPYLTEVASGGAVNRKYDRISPAIIVRYAERLEGRELAAAEHAEDLATAAYKAARDATRSNVAPVPTTVPSTHRATSSHAADGWTPPEASERARGYLQDLLRDRVHAWDTDSLEELEQAKFGRRIGPREASEAIDYLSRQPLRREQTANDATGRSSWPHVADGRYAVPTDAGHLGFYRVRNAANGRVYLNVFASDAQHDVPFRSIGAILRKIAAEPREAMKRFGRELGSCGRCGRTLTDETSRGRGIGPECWTKM